VRVVQIIGNSAVGGAERHLLDLVEGLGPLGVECAVVCPRPGPLTDGLASRGVPVTCLEIVLPRPGDEYGLDWCVVERLAAQLQALRPDVVHSHLYPAHLHGTLAAHLVDVPAIVHSAHTLVVRAGDVLLSRLTTVRTITMAHAAAQLLVRAGVPYDRITVIYNGVSPEHRHRDPAAEQAARAALGLPSGPKKAWTCCCVRSRPWRRHIQPSPS
jgi:glycosyltransferase involved in cell wall biosynthesis